MPTIRYTALTLIKESRSPKMRMKSFAEILGVTILGFLADCLYALLCTLRLISTVRPASDYKVRFTFQQPVMQLIDSHQAFRCGTHLRC